MNGNCDLPRHRVGMASCVVGKREVRFEGIAFARFTMNLIVVVVESATFLFNLQSIDNEIPLSNND